jgi:hypothetical protein
VIRIWAAVVAALLAVATAHATLIQVDLGATGRLTSDTTVLFGDLNGTALNGQSLSLDFVFANSEFARLFTVTTSFEVSVSLQTNGTGLVGFLDGTGYLTDQNGGPLHAPQALGSASSSDASMTAGLFPLSSVSTPLDDYGVHFDLLFPLNPSLEITGGEFRLYAYGDSGPYGVGPGVPRNIVPEGGDTAILLAISLTGIVMAYRRMRKSAGRI